MPWILTVCQVRGLKPYLLGTIFPLSINSNPTPSLSSTVPSPTPIAVAVEIPLPMSPTPVEGVLPPITQTTPYALLAVPIALLSAFFPISLPTPPNTQSILYTATEAKWHEHDGLARAHIILNVVDILGSGLLITSSAVDAWCFLCNCFELWDPIVVQDMHLRLASSWYEEGMAVVEHFHSLCMLWDTMNHAGAAITKGEFCQIVLMTFLINGVLSTMVMMLLTCQDSMVAESVLSSQETCIHASAL